MLVNQKVLGLTSFVTLSAISIPFECLPISLDRLLSGN